MITLLSGSNHVNDFCKRELAEVKEFREDDQMLDIDCVEEKPLLLEAFPIQSVDDTIFSEEIRLLCKSLY